MLDLLIKYRAGFFSGLLVTLKLCALIWSIGLLVGALFGVAAARAPGSLGRLSRLASFVLSGTPVLVILFWLHYPAQAVFGIVVDPFYTAAFALSIVNIISVADLVREAVSRFPRELIIAAQVCGVSPLTIARRIQLPIILRGLTPSLLMLQVSMLHATMFASLISVEEVFRVAQRVNAIEYRPVEIYTALAFFFLLVCLPINGIALFLQRKYRRDLSEA